MKEHKLKNTYVSDVDTCSAILGMGCWNRFKIRHKDRIVSKKGQHFELDHANWTVHAHFKFMHDNIGAEIVEANITVEFDEPV